MRTTGRLQVYPSHEGSLGRFFLRSDIFHSENGPPTAIGLHSRTASGWCARHRSGSSSSSFAVPRMRWVMTLSRYIDTSSFIRNALATNDIKLALRIPARICWSWDQGLTTKKSGGCWSRFRQLAFPEVERSDRAIDRLTELSNGQVRVFELSEATRPALGSLFTTLSWHDELSAKELEVRRDLLSLPLKSMPKSGAIVRSRCTGWNS